MLDPDTQTPQVRLQELAAAFHRDGFVVVSGLCPDDVCAGLREQVEASLNPMLAPAEFEADVGYPGSPTDRQAKGGDTPRRLLYACSRFRALRSWVTSPDVKQYLQALLNAEAVSLSQCHHNCIMTKYPSYSSDTLWHQDVRYWAFQRPELVSLWLALGEEQADNGALQVIPGSHRQAYAAGQLDEAQFLRPDLPENQALIERAVTVELHRGDVLFFHCRTFHAAGRNRTRDVKLSGVFTYHDRRNQAVPGTKSAQYPSIPL